ncbi:MAG TPA: hypothetical protein EYH34_07760 [Planctomycetes bacterium]|nr:hypothetical protein [Planctomycetota bacterium]
MPEQQDRATGPADHDTLILSASVVTMAHVDGRLEGIRFVAVPQRAVVTPAVRDELHRRQVTLVYRDEPKAKGTPPVRLVVGVLGSRFDPRGLLAALEGEPVQVELERYDCLVAATDALAAALAQPNTLGVLVTTHPAAALCLANRHRGVRAVWGVEPSRLDECLGDVGANLLVVHPGMSGPFLLRRMVTQFCRRGPAHCPPALEERLGS